MSMKSFKEYVTEEVTHIYRDHKNVPHLENEHDAKKLSNRLVIASDQHYDDHGQEGDHDHLSHYTRLHKDDETNQEYNGSHKINRKLIDGQKLDDHERSVHEAIHRTAHPVGDHIHFYSGVGFDPQKMAEHSADKILHSPAHLSVTHHLPTAVGFASRDYNSKYRHLIHIHAKPEDKVSHVSHISEFDSEHESILPSGAKLKYSHTTDHIASHGDNFKVHHFTIHSQ